MSIYTVTPSMQQEIASLEAEYTSAIQLNYARKLQIQINVINQLCKMQVPEAFKAVSDLMLKGIHHEYMNDAIPDMLMTHWQPSCIDPNIATILIKGTLHSQNETMQCKCIQKLVDARYGKAYATLVDLRNHLIDDKEQRPVYWSRLLSTVVEGMIKLEPHCDKILGVPHQSLWSSQLFYLNHDGNV